MRWHWAYRVSLLLVVLLGRPAGAQPEGLEGHQVVRNTISDAAQLEILEQDAPSSAKARGSGPDARDAAHADGEPHESGPIDPWKPRPAIPPPGAMEHAGPWTRGPFKSIQVNVDADGNNIVGDAANEPSIAIDPTNPNNIVIGWRQFDSVESNFRQAGYAYSHDGGQTWTFPGVLEPLVFRSDPVLSYDADGLFYYYSLSEDFTCQLFRSLNSGESWIGPIEAFGGDKAWITIDRTGGMGHGQIYCAWDHAGCCDNDVYTRSIDGGLTYSAPIPVPGFPIWGVTTVGVDGANYVVGRRVRDNSAFVLAKSTTVQNPDSDPGFDFARELNLGGSLIFFTGRGPNPGGLGGQVWVATDHSDRESRGNIYVLASVDPGGDDPLDIMFIRSTDGGLTWTDPLRINDDDAKSGAWQWFGTLSVSPNGRIDVVFNDTRNTDTISRSETFHSYSNDGGLSWSKNVPISPEWDSHIGWPNQGKIGDYYDMISDDAAVNLAYAATFNGEQDVYFIRVIPDCNQNDIPDDEDIRNGTSDDCNENGIPDECDRLSDCNDNGILDECDIADGTSEDCNGDVIPDECQPDEDCDENGVRDLCELEGDDCNENLALDACDITGGTSEDCNQNDIPDECDIDDGASGDCNENRTPDECDIANGTSEDCDGDEIPDECVAPEDDCNRNRVPDECDIADGTSDDCDRNGVPDECDTQDELFKLLPDDGAEGDRFGVSVAINGETIVVGAYQDSDNGTESGSAYLFDAATRRQIAKILPDDGEEGDYFGISVAIGDTSAIVGAFEDDDNGTDSGSAYLFDTTTGRQIAKFLASDGAAGDKFGVSVALHGTTAVVGAYWDDANGRNSGSAYLFDITTGREIAKLLPDDGARDDYFGSSVAISETTAIVGARWDDDNGSDSGSAYLFDISTGRQIAKLLPTDGEGGDHFGGRVAISGTTAIIGARGDGDNGEGSGSAYIFDTSTGRQIAKLLPTDGEEGDRFGSSVAMSGPTVIVGAERESENSGWSGAAYVFDTSTGRQLAKLLASDGANSDRLGSSVAISGGTAIVGAPQDDDNGSRSGSVYVFDVGKLGDCPSCLRDPEWLCDGDVDGDGQVNPVDSGLVQAAFGSGDQQDLCNYDVDCDGQINPVDSGIVQSLFETCEESRDVCP